MTKETIIATVMQFSEGKRQVFSFLSRFGPRPATFTEREFGDVTRMSQPGEFLELYLRRGLVMKEPNGRYSISSEVREVAQSLAPE